MRLEVRDRHPRNLRGRRLEAGRLDLLSFLPVVVGKRITVARAVTTRSACREVRVAMTATAMATVMVMELVENIIIMMAAKMVRMSVVEAASLPKSK